MVFVQLPVTLRVAFCIWYGKKQAGLSRVQPQISTRANFQPKHVRKKAKHHNVPYSDDIFQTNYDNKNKSDKNNYGTTKDTTSQTKTNQEE